MPFRRKRRPPLFAGFVAPPLLHRAAGIAAALLPLVLALAIIVPISSFLKELASSIALSDASDLITVTVNDTINRKMAEGDFGYDYFVTLEKDNAGNITAITANMSRINTLSSEVLREIIAAGDCGSLDVRVPLGNLLGANILLGKGPEIPVEIIMLTSSYADFRNELVSSGINQTKHQIILEVVVDIDILVPWDTLSTQVVSEILVAETVIVGRVPDTYVKVE